MTQTQSPLRVLHVVECLGAGVLDVVAALTPYLLDDGNAVAVAYGTRPETPASPQTRFPPQTELFDLGWGQRRPFGELGAGRRLRALVASWRPDVVHLHSSFAGFTGSMALIGSRVPIIYTPHSFASRQPNTSRQRRAAFSVAERLAVRRATVVGAVSHSEREDALALGASEVAVVANGVPPREPGEPRSGRPVICGSGRLVAQRRPDAVARVLSRVSDLADTVWIGGGGDGAYADAARSALADADVETTGWLSRDDAMQRFGEATAYLHWTSWDGQPLSILEAIARDVIVVASDIPPNREILPAAQLCADEDAAVALLRAILTDPATAARIRDAQGERRDYFTAERMSREWLAVYRGLDDSDRPASA